MPPELQIDSSGRENPKKASVITFEDSLAEPPEISSHFREREIQRNMSGNLLNKQNTEASSVKNDGAEKPNRSESASSLLSDICETTLARKNAASREDRSDFGGSSKKMRKSENEVNSTSSDTIESSIIGLQELVHRVRLLKGLVHYGFDFSNAMTPS